LKAFPLHDISIRQSDVNLNSKSNSIKAIKLPVNSSPTQFVSYCFAAVLLMMQSSIFIPIKFTTNLESLKGNPIGGSTSEGQSYIKKDGCGKKLKRTSSKNHDADKLCTVQISERARNQTTNADNDGDFSVIGNNLREGILECQRGILIFITELLKVGYIQLKKSVSSYLSKLFAVIYHSYFCILIEVHNG
jgi:hypothetical protein